MKLCRLDTGKAGRGGRAASEGRHGRVDAAHLYILNRVCTHDLRANVLDIVRGEVEADEEGLRRDGILAHLYHRLELVAL